MNDKQFILLLKGIARTGTPIAFALIGVMASLLIQHSASNKLLIEAFIVTLPILCWAVSQTFLRIKLGSFNQLYNSCSPKMQPVVGYRNPQVDARTAVYIMYGNTLCSSFFKDSGDKYSNYGMFINKMSLKRVKKKGKLTIVTKLQE